MRVFAKDWGREIYFDSIEEMLGSIKNDRIKSKVYKNYLMYIPITRESSFLIRRTKKGFIMGVYRLHEVIRPFPLYEAPSITSLRMLQGSSSK